MDFHELSWKDWAITKRFANKLFARQPACKENLRNFFTGRHFQAMQEEMWSIKKTKKKDWKGNQNSDSDTAGEGLRCFFLDFFFFFVGGGFTHSSGPEIVPTNQGLHPECYRLNC